jgi:geranylgeranyl diphosphate synthase type I
MNLVFQPAIDQEMRRAIANPALDRYLGLADMLSYHLGWSEDGAVTTGQGKRIRPLLVLLTAAACGADWQSALPAAAAVELLHNFSLIHDDIEDRSELRRGRPTLWTRWGSPLAINAGDALFNLSFMALQRLEETCSPLAALRAHAILQQTCLDLTGGQHLDISYEDSRELPLEAYWPMTGGKTAALLGACAELGAVAAQAGVERQAAFGRFGRSLGLAFQVQDDWLGIWGEAEQTGKSTESDLLTGKKTLPVLYALRQGGRFAERWRQGSLQPGEVQGMADLLVTE